MSEQTPDHDRDHDVVLYGATGFVGRLVAEHLAATAPPGARIALAGRDRGRLADVRAGLAGEAADWPLLVADAADDAQVAALARSARVVATTVGPYSRYGHPVVAACVAAGTSYADLTGEVLFARESADRHHDAARSSGARIVHACGFDSVPSDLAVHALADRAAADGAGTLGRTTLVVRSAKGGVSGGTIDSMRSHVDALRSDRVQRRIAFDPYALSPDRDAEPDRADGDGDGRDGFGVSWDGDLGTWTGPFVMAPFNTRIVRRSNALRGWAYGRGFRYREVIGFGSGPLAPVLAAGTAAGIGVVAGGMALSLTRPLLDRVLPDPGEGPSERTRREGRFRVDVHTTTSTGARYVATVAAQGDPGYAATAVMFGQAALSLALDDLPESAGVLTPATAMGTALADRLVAQGFTIEVRTA
jgi:short subunit dehydrogenase-like uncharacterized protein